MNKVSRVEQSGAGHLAKLTFFPYTSLFSLLQCPVHVNVFGLSRNFFSSSTSTRTEAESFLVLHEVPRMLNLVLAFQSAEAGWDARGSFSRFNESRQLQTDEY